jgi:CspA family cold shock protein
MTEGTLRWFNEATGYGLVRPDDGGGDLFVRATDMAIDDGAEPLEEGAEVRYEVKRGNGMRAINVSRRRRYSWRDDSLQRHEGKEARNAYYEGLEERAPLG